MLGSLRDSQDRISLALEKELPSKNMPSSPMEEESTSPDVGHSPSEISKAVKRLKEATIQAANKRGKLPQPLFWSLFANEIAEIKKQKAAKRTLDILLGS